MKHKRKHKRRGIYFAGSSRDAKAITTRLATENPNMTISEYLNKYHKDLLILN